MLNRIAGRLPRSLETSALSYAQAACFEIEQFFLVNRRSARACHPPLEPKIGGCGAIGCRLSGTSLSEA